MFCGDEGDNGDETDGFNFSLATVIPVPVHQTGQLIGPLAASKLN